MSRAFTWTDPFDDMSDEEFDEQVAKLARVGVPYQTFMKRLLEAGIARLERKPATRRASGSGPRRAR